ncbi:putative xanthine dehydrogenase, iron-sulfur binding subunit [Escherichia coli]|nr:putative xanthine dehydrogenase, iron-sulfur binding subunit [Escherichia coli]
MSNQGEYPEDNRVGKHEPHDLSLTRRDLIKVSAGNGGGRRGLSSFYACGKRSGSYTRA